MSDIVKLTAGAVSKAVELTNRFKVDTERMLANLEMTNGLIYAGNISLALADKIGKTEADTLVEKCCSDAQSKGMHLKEVVVSDQAIRQYLSQEAIEKLFDAAHSGGLSENYINAVLKARVL